MGCFAFSTRATTSKTSKPTRTAKTQPCGVISVSEKPATEKPSVAAKAGVATTTPLNAPGTKLRGGRSDSAAVLSLWFSNHSAAVSGDFNLATRRIARNRRLYDFV